MKKILILKTGSAHSTIVEKYGDFENYFINQMGIASDNFRVLSVYTNIELPEFVDVSAVIITGSHSMVTDNDNWSIRLSQWIRDIAQENIPIMGVCYGHQLLASAFGGTVDYNPKGKEIGTVNIELTEEGQRDPLLGVLPKKFFGQVYHSQTVTKLPPNARLLAKNDFEQHHAFAINGNIWGVQFHPELNADIVLAYIEHEKKYLIEEGYNVEQLKSSVCNNFSGKLLLDRFMEFI